MILRIEIGGLGRRHRVGQAGGNCVPTDTVSQRVPRRLDPADKFGVGSGGLPAATWPDPSPFEISSDASPAVLRNSHATCLIISNWSITASLWLRRRRAGPRSCRGCRAARWWFPCIPWPAPARREAFGLCIASQDSASTPSSPESAGSIPAPASSDRRIRSWSSTAAAGLHRRHLGIADRARKYFSTVRLHQPVIVQSARVGRDRSLRRLCIALNRFAEASATTEIRLVMASRSQESQALTQSSAITQIDIRTMTDLISVRHGETVQHG